MVEDRLLVEVWHLLIGMGAVAAGFWPVLRARRADNRDVARWRNEIDQGLGGLRETIGRLEKRFSIDEHIHWRATVDAALKSGRRYDEEHRAEHAEILKGVGAIQKQLSGMDTRLSVMEAAAGKG